MERIFGHRLMQILLLAAAYAVLGEASLLLLGYEHGYVAPLWLPAGLAFGVLLLRPQLWPGVWLGSLLGKIPVLLASSGPQEAAHLLMLYATVASGATLQALFGMLLVRRFIGPDPALTDEREVLTFMLLAGPVSCTISPTSALLSQLVAGQLPPGDMLHMWIGWWLGDIIGVFLFAPLTIEWLSKQDFWRPRRRALTVAVLMMCAVAILVFGAVNRFSSRTAWQRFEHESSLVTAVFQRRADVAVEMVRALNGLFAASEHVEADEFARFSAALLWHRTEVNALLWAPRSADAGGFTVLYMDAPAGTSLHRGFALASVPELRETLERSRDTGAIGSVALSRAANRGVQTYLLLAPSYDKSLPATVTASERRAHLRGFSGAIVDVNELSLVTRTDVRSTPHLPWTLEDRAAEAATNRTAQHEPLMHRLLVADREWSLRFEPTPAYLSKSQLAAWIVLGTGLAFTVFIVAGALVVTGRTMTVQAEVQARTEELAHINSKLAEEVCGHISTEEALGRERELLKAIFDNLGEGILVMDASYDVTMANRAAHTMLLRVAGSSAVLDKGWASIVETYAADGVTRLGFYDLPIVRALHGETVRDAEIVIAFGRRPPVRTIFTAQPLRTLGTQQPGAIAIVRDITDAHKVERLKREFVATVSHELRTPLTSIRGSLGLLHSSTLMDVEKTRKLIDMAMRNTERLTFLINDLLDIEKIEQGGMKFDFSEQSLDLLVQQAVDSQQGHAQACNVRVRVTGGALSPVLVDPQRLLQVLANLLSNAIKFSPAGGEVIVQRIQLDGRCRVAITDQGPGIALEFRDRLFEKFSQADSSDARTKGGTGLGLAISKALIEHMGGLIGFESEPGRGATFFFELPTVETLAPTS